MKKLNKVIQIQPSQFYYHNNKNSLEDEFNNYFAYFLYFNVVIIFKRYMRNNLINFLINMSNFEFKRTVFNNLSK